MEKQTMGGVISARRKALGMTQAQLAQLMNVTDKAVSKWERDLSCPDVSALSRLAEALEVPVDTLVQAKSVQPPQNNKEAAKLIGTILKAVPLAMGIAVAVTSILGKIDMRSACMMLGLGLACLALEALRKGQE